MASKSGVPVALTTRRTQAERSATTRAQLLDATIECLFELGYVRTTTSEIAERAGLSRGAQLHHFPTKAELVTTAVEHLFARRHGEFVAAIARLPAGADRASAAIDLLWSMVSGPTFYAWLELAVAARTDPELKRSVGALTSHFIEVVQRTFPQLFPPPTEPNPFYDIAPTFVFALMDGLALHEIHAANPERRHQTLAALKGLARLALPPSGGA
jgi:AcrR family transcriptional regulator